MNRLILASASPRRNDLVSLLGIPFEVRPSSVDEDGLELSGPPSRQAVDAALAKASDVALSAGGAWVLGADTVVCVDGRILGKPRDAGDARQMLSLLSGRAHEVTTGLCLARLDAPDGTLVTHTAYEQTKVWMMPLTPERIDAYVKTGEPMDKAGSYGIQGIGGTHIPRIEGCYFNVMGLPLYRLARLLEAAGAALDSPMWKEGGAP